VTIVPQTLAAPASIKGGVAVDPVLRQIRDLVYKVSGIYKAEDKLYLLADGCGRRMMQLRVRTAREYWNHLTSQPSRDGCFGNC
jgi:chemotaxis methyl-accepting protein methylase